MEVYFTRQPIFDKFQSVHGYDLLFKSGFDKIYDNTGWEAANHTAMVLNFLSSNLMLLTRGRRAFIQFSRNMLIQEMFDMFPSDLLTVAIAQDSAEDSEIIDICEKLYKSGHILTLQVLEPEALNGALSSQAKILQIDYNKIRSKENFQLFADKIKGRQVKLFATNVHSREDFETAIKRGFSYFQGDFYKKANTGNQEDDKIPFSKMHHFRLLQEINHPDVEFEKLSNIIKRDVSLSYKLMRYINSAFFGFQNEIKSIKYALALLGLMQIKKWLSKVTLREMGAEKPEELIMTSIIRARFCELLGAKTGLKQRETELFLLGLFSMLDAFLEVSIDKIFEDLPLSEDISNALTGKPSPFQELFGLVLAYERGDWQSFSSHANELDIDESEVPLLFLKSIEWANQVFFD